ncbi:MAG: hypothetical protein SGJ10_03035 [Bacteroidota bacterium]|nr:hypothetical protein [Bacteroidota bacterium]
MYKLILNRAQDASLGFDMYSYALSKIVNRLPSQNFKDFFNSFSDAVSHFGEQELYARAAERSTILKINPELSKYNGERADRFKLQGQEALTQSLNALKGLREESMKEEQTRNKVGDFKVLQNDYVQMIVAYEIKPSDVEKLDKTLTEVLEVAKTNGEKGLFDYIEKKINELSKLRNNKDRGAIDNIPYWKLVAIAVFIGVTVWLVWRCVVKGKNCSQLSSVISALGKTLIGLLQQFC